MIRIILASVLLSVTALAHAHKASDSYLRIDASSAPLQVQWDIALRDLELAIGLDTDGDDAITWDELRARQADIVAYAGARLAIRTDDQPCSLAFEKLLVDRHSDGAYAVLRFTSPCAGAAIDLDYRLLFDLDAQHRGLVSVRGEGAEAAVVMSPVRPAQRITLGEPQSLADRFMQFVGEGIWHIWIGADHILFLLSLLLPLLALRGGKAPIATASLAWDITKIVTAFTVAHSLTLIAATLGWVRVPAQWTETAIAATVLVVALLNLFSTSHARRWTLAFALGLVHGLGFANVLSELGLFAKSLIVSLVAFNVGVEVGQLAIVAAFLLLTFAWSRRASYRLIAVRGGSVAIGLVAMMWIVQRF